MQVASFNRFVFLTFARCGFIAGTVGNEAVIAVGHAHRHGIGAGRSFSASLIASCSCLRWTRSSGEITRSIFGIRNRNAADHLIRQQHLAGRPLGVRRRNRFLDIRGKFRVFTAKDPIAVGFSRSRRSDFNAATLALTASFICFQSAATSFDVSGWSTSTNPKSDDCSR